MKMDWSRVKTTAGRAGIGILTAGMWVIIAANAAAELADPMRPSYMYNGGTTRAGLVLQSTFVSGQRKGAIINGRLLREGGFIGRARVIEIKRNEVILQKGKRLIHLRVMPKLAKKYKSTQSKDNGSSEE